MKVKLNTLESINKVAKVEFLNHGFKGASLRNICKKCSITTGAFYGYYKSKEELFDGLVGNHLEYIKKVIEDAFSEFVKLSAREQLVKMNFYTNKCLFEILHYCYKYLDEFRLMLLFSEGTKYEKVIDDLVEIETGFARKNKDALNELGKSFNKVDKDLEHVLITGLFSTFFEMIIHQMPLNKAENYLKNMIDFYIAGWTKILHN